MTTDPGELFEQLDPETRQALRDKLAEQPSVPAPTGNGFGVYGAGGTPPPPVPATVPALIEGKLHPALWNRLPGHLQQRFIDQLTPPPPPPPRGDPPAAALYSADPGNGQPGIPWISVDSNGNLYVYGVQVALNTLSGFSVTTVVAYTSGTQPTPGVPGPVGAYVNKANYTGTTQTTANSTFNGYIGGSRNLTAKATKVYWSEGVWTGPNSPSAADVTVNITAGARLLVAFVPARSTTNTYTTGSQATITGTTIAAEAASLAAAILAYQTAGANLDVILFNEPNLAVSNFTPATYTAWMTYYQATVRAAATNPDGSKVRCTYCPAIGNDAYDEIQMYPGDANVDMIVADYYANNWVANLLLDSPRPGETKSLMSLADNHSPSAVPFGIGEFNDSTKPTNPTSVAQWNNFITYLISVFGGRLAAGKTNGPIIFWLGSHATTEPQNQVNSAADYKVPGLQLLYDTLAKAQAAAPVLNWVPPPNLCRFRVSISLDVTIAGTSTVPSLTYTAFGGAAFSANIPLWQMNGSATAPSYLCAATGFWQNTWYGETDKSSTPVSVTLTPTGSTFAYTIVIEQLTQE